MQNSTVFEWEFPLQNSIQAKVSGQSLHNMAEMCVYVIMLKKQF